MTDTYTEDDIETSAVEAYDVYGYFTDHRNYQGLPMPRWVELPPTIQAAWKGVSQFFLEKAAKRWMWRRHFDERQLKEIKFNVLYAGSEFSHGTEGHNARLIIAKMAKLLDGQYVE